MIGSSRRGKAPRRFLIAAVAALVPLVAGCEAGNNAPVLQWHQPTDGTLAYAGTGNSITIANVFVLGPRIGATLRSGQNAGLFLGLVNTGAADRLIAIKAPGIAQSVRLPAGGVPLLTKSRVLLSGPQPAVVLEHLVRPLSGGTVIKIYLIFKNAGTTGIDVPVMPMVSHYTTYSPPPSSPTATATTHPRSSRSPGSPTPSPSPSSSH